MILPLTYRRPPLVRANEGSFISSTSVGTSGGTSVSTGTTAVHAGIPDALAFDRIVNGGTCPPCTTRDFMNYLIYVEHAAENLQFFLWFRDYVKRFSELPDNIKILSPQANAEKLEAETAKSPRIPNSASKTAAIIFKGTDFATPRVVTTEKSYNPYFESPLETPAEEQPGSFGPWDDTSTTSLYGSRKADTRQAVADAFEAADVKWQPFTIQPFREEIARIIATYITDGAPRQLNLASKERNNLLRALATTTHPSAFQAVLRTAEWSLRHQAHPNFIRWTICNGNRPRVLFARGLGIAGILIGTVVAILLTISRVHRGWRALCVLPLIIGIATLICAEKGMCVVLHGLHHRHLRPWELFNDDVEDDRFASTNDLNKLENLDSFGGGSNSYEDQPWVARYQKRNVVRKIFDREVWVQEPALRQIQDTIFLQAMLVALAGTAVVTAVFCALPSGNRY